MSAERISILVDPKRPMYCDDYERDGQIVRVGCGMEIKNIRGSDGKTTACMPVQLPCKNKEGETVWVYVPHWIHCPDSRDYLIRFMRSKAEKNAEYRDRKREEEQGARPVGQPF